MATEQQVLDLIREAGDFVPADVLDNFGASTATLQSLVASGKVNLFKVADVDLANGISMNIEEPYANLTGASGAYVSTPDSAAVSVTGDLDLRLDLSMADWTPGAGVALLSKWDIGGSSRSYHFLVFDDGQLRFQWRNAAGSTTDRFSGSVPSFTNDTRYQVRVTLDVDNGSGQHEVKFFTRSAGNDLLSNTGWTQLGSTFTGSGTTSIFDGTATVGLGTTNGTNNRLTGRVYRASISNAIGGAPVAEFNPLRDASLPATTVVAQTGETWTLNGEASPLSGLSYIEVNDADWLKPTMELSCRMKVQLTDYTSGTSRTLMVKDTGYRFSLTSADKYNLTINRASDAAAVSYTSTDPIDLINNNIYWLRADWTDPNDDGDAEVSFFVSSDLVADSEDVTTWTLIETLTDTSHGISYNSNNVYIGNKNGNASETIEGVLYAAEFYGENQRQMQYSFEYSAQLPVFSNIVRDNYSNVLSIVGTSHRFINNTIGKIYYKFND
jgi:hypothetical protein